MAAYVIGNGPMASKLIKWLRTNLLHKRNQNLNEINCLIQLGYSRKLAAYALKVNKFGDLIINIISIKLTVFFSCISNQQQLFRCIKLVNKK